MSRNKAGVPPTRCGCCDTQAGGAKITRQGGALTNSDAPAPGDAGKPAWAPRVVSRPQGECDMRVPQVSERIKEAPAQALRGVFAGIGQLLLITDKLRNKTPVATDVPRARTPEASKKTTVTSPAGQNGAPATPAASEPAVSEPVTAEPVTAAPATGAPATAEAVAADEAVTAKPAAT